MTNALATATGHLNETVSNARIHDFVPEVTAPKPLVTSNLTQVPELPSLNPSVTSNSTKDVSPYQIDTTKTSTILPATSLAPRQQTTIAQRTTPFLETCLGEKLLPAQPIYSDYAQVTKCSANESLAVEFVWAIFYANCIEDVGNATVLKEEIFNPCNSGTHINFVYGDLDDDSLFVLQNGSLFRSNKNQSEYDIFETYCLMADQETGKTVALVCYDGLVSVSKAQAYLYAICKFP